MLCVAGLFGGNPLIAAVALPLRLRNRAVSKFRAVEAPRKIATVGLPFRLRNADTVIP